MTSLFRRVCLCTCGLAMLASGAISYGATVSLKAVKKNNVDVAPTNVISAEPGDEIVAELFLSGWGSDHPGEDSQLITYQAQLDGFGSFLLDNELVMILPKGWDMPSVKKCTTNADCSTTDSCSMSCLAGSADACGRPCSAQNPCSLQCPEYPVCSPLGLAYCVGVDHAPQNFNFICSPNDNCTAVPRADLCNVNHSPLPASRVASIDLAYGGASISGTGEVDVGQSCYAGTATLVLQPDACGSIEIDILGDVSSTFMTIFVDGQFVDPAVTTQPLVINTSVECPSFVPKIKSTLPENCDVDHRYPHSPTATLPAFWFNPDFEFTINFDGLPGDNGGMFQVGDFAVSQTGAGGSPPSILPETFSQNGTSVTFSLNRPAVGTRWTCVRYVPCQGTDNECMACWARFPGDVNGDRIMNSTDLTALIGIVQDGTPADEVDCDMDRSGSCVAPDIIGWIDLFNGAGEFIAWGTQPTQVTCPSQ